MLNEEGRKPFRSSQYSVGLDLPYNDPFGTDDVVRAGETLTLGANYRLMIPPNTAALFMEK